MPRYTRARLSTSNYFKKTSAPTAAEGASIGDLWADTSASPVSINKCSSITPVTWVDVTSASPSTSFTTIAVSGQDNVVSDSTSDTLTLAAGSGISIATTAASDTITITNSGAANTFSTIAVSGQSDVVADSGTDTLTLAGGTGITLTTNATTDTVTITNSGAANTFSTIAVSGQSDVVADSGTDTLTLAAGTGVAITTNASTDTITVATTGLAASGANTDITSVYLNNTGLKIKDTNASHGLTIKPGSDLSADRILTLTTGDAARTITINGDPTLSGINTGDQTITLTGDVTGSGTGSFATSLGNGVVTSTHIANGTILTGDIADATILTGNIAAGTITGDNIATGTITSANITDATIVAGDIASDTITATQMNLNGYKGGSGARVYMGKATLSSGTITVNDIGVTSASTIFLTAQDSSTIGVLQVGTIVANTSFDINSTVGADSGVVGFWRVGP